MSSVRLPDINILNTFDASLASVNGPNITLTTTQVFDLELWTDSFVTENLTNGVYKYGLQYVPEQNSVFLMYDASIPTGVNCFGMGRNQITGYNNIIMGYYQNDGGRSNVISIKAAGTILGDNLLCIGSSPDQTLNTYNLAASNSTHVIRTYINGELCYIPLIYIPGP